jgi:hypothetical protein
MKIGQAWNGSLSLVANDDGGDVDELLLQNHTMCTLIDGFSFASTF